MDKLKTGSFSEALPSICMWVSEQEEGAIHELAGVNAIEK